jgi:hypothetical protein
MRLVALALLCAGCSGVYTEGQPGPQGEQGEQGPQGIQGPAGPPGPGGCLDGPRLKCVWIEGADGSRVPAPEMLDSSEDDPDGRDEFCTWRLYKGARVCMPPMLDATVPNAWVDPGCPITGPWVMPRLHAPADYPDGTSVVRLISAEPSINNRPIMRMGPVTTYYAKIGGGPCTVAPSDLIPEPHEWYDLDPSDFVGGALQPQ